MNAIVVRIHPVDDQISSFFRKSSFHQAQEIDLLPVFKNAQCIPVLQLFFNIEIIIKDDPGLLDLSPVCPGDLIVCLEISILDPVLLKALIISNDHTPVGYQKPGDQTDRKDQKDKNDQIFPEISSQLPQVPFPQGILPVFLHARSLCPSCRLTRIISYSLFILQRAVPLTSDNNP